jgi:hypothetical protein
VSLSSTIATKIKVSIMRRIKFLSTFLILGLYIMSCSKDGEQQQDNHTPIANAGNDTTITLPANTAILNATLSTDPDNNIKTYQWTKISGPICNIANANAAQTQVTSLTAGVYVFELKVTDANDLFDKDTMQVTVSSKPVNVYVAGYEFNANGTAVAKLWKNGIATNLTDGTKEAVPASVFVLDNSDVYVAGYERDETGWPIGKIWKNGVAVIFPGTIGASAVYGSGSDVYAAGYGEGIARLWKNGVISNLNDGSVEAGGSGVYVSGSNVYLLGYRWFGNYAAVTLWKNGAVINITKATTMAQAYSINGSGNDVYIAGYENNANGIAVAKLWKNGIASNFSDGTKNTYLFSVCISGSDVYVVGMERKSGDVGGIAKLWKNGIATNLTDGSKEAYAYSVTVSDSGDVYVVGHDGNVAKLWKNGVATDLSNGTNVARAHSVFVQ